MLYLLLKAGISAIIIVAVSEIAKRSPGVGALFASLPLVSVLGMIWLWRDTHDPVRMAAHAGATFWFVLPSLPMFLVIPAMYVALHNGVEIFDSAGALISEDKLIFTVLPELFSTMGLAGSIVSFTFFFLMSIAALTSSISMLEVPVAYTIEEHNVGRKTSVVTIGLLIALTSTTILLNFDALFGLVVETTTRYSQPLLGFIFCVYAGWIWHRNNILKELRKGSEDIENTLFWKIWPWYVRLVCPIIIMGIFIHSIFG